MKNKLVYIVFCFVSMSGFARHGFLYTELSGSNNQSGSLWNSTIVKTSTELAYTYGYDHSNQTMGYASYMYMVKDVEYKFRVWYDDYASIKVDNTIVIDRAGFRSGTTFGSYRPAYTGYHRFELRLFNESGYYGYDPSNLGSNINGAYYSVDNGNTWMKFSDQGWSVFSTTGDDACVVIKRSAIRENDPTVMDVDYVAYSLKPSVKVRVLAFEDGVRSLAKVVRPETFVDGTGVNVGDAVTPNVEHRISWRVSSDWTTKLAKVKFEVLASEGELMPLETMTIPASDQYGKMKITWNAINESQVFDALLWLYADKDPGLTLSSGVLKNGATQVASGTGISAVNAMKYIYSKLGYSLLTGAPLTYANQETRLGLSPSGARQYGYKIVK